MGEGKSRWLSLFTDLCYAACIAVQCWVVLDMATDGETTVYVKSIWQKLHKQATTEQEIQRQYSHVLFEAINTLEGKYGTGPTS